MRPLLVALVLAAALPYAARAEDPDSPLKQKFNRAEKLYDLGRYREAAREYEAIYEVQDRPGLLFNIGQAYRLAGDDDDALRAYRAYLRRAPEAENRAQVEALIAELEAKRAAPSATPPPVAPPPLAPPPQVTAAPAAVTTAPPARSRRWLVAPLVVLGASVALAATGAGLVGSVAPEYDRLKSTCGATGCPPGDVDALEARANAGYAFLGLAGAAAVLDVVLFAVGATKRR